MRVLAEEKRSGREQRRGAGGGESRVTKWRRIVGKQVRKEETRLETVEELKEVLCKRKVE